MKYILLVPDGMADEPIPELGNRTPLEVANTTNMDYLAQRGSVGLVKTIPPGMQPGSDIGNLAVLGYNPRKQFPGRASLEAANLGVDIAEDEVAFRANLVTIENRAMADYCAGHIATQQASGLIDTLNKDIGFKEVKFYVGKSYRHLMILKTLYKKDMLKVACTPPHDILGKPIERSLPQGKHAQLLWTIMERSGTILADHQINKVRVDLKENPANMIWLWGQGAKAVLPPFTERFGVTGSVISAVDLVNGIGKLAGLEVVKVPNVTGYYDTNYKGKAEYALQSLETHDFVFVHVEATDEASHNGDTRMKITCIERFDKDVVGTILNYFDKHEDVRILLLPDHPTPIAKRTHTADPVCFVMYGTGIPVDGTQGFSESLAAEKGLRFKSGEALMSRFMKKYA